MKKQYYTVSEIAKLLKVSEGTVRNWIKKGELQSIKVGRVQRIPEDALETFLRDASQEPHIPEDALETEETLETHEKQDSQEQRKL